MDKQNATLYSFNYLKLRGLIHEKGISEKKLAKLINISSTSLSHKLNNHSDFTQNEIIRICLELRIDLKDVEKYFFYIKNC